ncbi:GNAT family N-acetyltransferase [Deminuibacter soli]|uniref:GNAT family N-acetyltransferase n=1 Tax=Deminuibacter soli TaxID=2291815 RepID=A0A3E1NRL7_9BACT|nr:GNAT family N-acetyltransferase [Deminuibacter soli]RFM30550.1 GNAT family N-acetyltransferase [Deminuibacter soli]
MMPAIHIVTVTPGQAQVLADVSRQTFYDAFAAQNSAADMEQHLEKTYNLLQITKELTSPHCRFYFAMAGDIVAGYMKLNFAPAQTELHDANALELERIYVVQNWQGQKIGQLLLNKAIALVKELRLQYLWLGVWEHNAKALAFYRRNGFVAFSTHHYTVGTDVQTDLMLKLDLLPA